MSEQRTAVVVGAGLSGLTAGYRLQQAGFHVTVVERDGGPGGRAQTEQRGGYVVDTGPDALTESYKHYLGLLNELGLGDRVVRSSQVAGLVRGGRIIDIDPAKPWRLPTLPILSGRGKLRLLRGLIGIRKLLGGIDPYDLVASADLDEPTVSAHDFARQHFGPEVAEYLIDPVVRLVTGSGGREASSLGILAALRSWSVPLVNVRGGLGVLPTALAERLEVRYRHTATAVSEDDRGVTVECLDADGKPVTLSADACVIAAMYDVAREIWPPLRGMAPEFAEHLRNVKLVSVSLGYRVPTASQAYAVLVPTAEYPDALLIFLQHHKAPDRVPAGHSLITIYTDTLVTDRYLAKSDAEIEAWAADVIETVCPELRGQRDLTVVTRWPKAGYLAAPGFWRRSRDLLAALPTDGRVQIAGDLFGAGSMESAVAWGERAAERLARRTSGASAAALT
jgi:protoporphyrinogen/coproporphyrinogen III oxidase